MVQKIPSLRSARPGLPQGSRRSARLVPTENFCSNPWPDQRYDWGMTIYQASSGAWVFNTATMEWAGASTITSRESKRTMGSTTDPRSARSAAIPGSILT